jgi:hypothetical protein
MTDTGDQGDPADVAGAQAGADHSAPDMSLADDISALIEDGKTYAEAELAFQKTRLSFAANRGKSGLVFVLAALAFLHLALIGLVIGSILSLSVALGPVWATTIVVGVLIIGMAIFLFLAKSKFSSLASAFQDTSAFQDRADG